MRLTNHSPFAASYMTAWDRDGHELLVLIVKCTYALDPDGKLRTAPEQLPVVMADEFESNQPMQLSKPSDFNSAKPGTDVLVQGSAWAPRGEPVASMPLTLRVGPLAVSARVWGDRRSEPSLLGWRLSDPRPFQRLPLTWERSFGGTDLEHPEKACCSDNPIGRGYRAGRPLSRDPIPAPNVEWEDSPYRGWSDPPRTLGFGPIHPAWEPRRRYAGTYDKGWRESRAPLVPEDFDSRFFHLAPPYLRTSEPLKGGERVEWSGFYPRVPPLFYLPRPLHQVVYRQRVLPSQLDAVWLRPDEMRMSMNWRSTIQLPEASSTAVEISILGKPLVRLGASP